jgi:hypothetical protein
VGSSALDLDQQPNGREESQREEREARNPKPIRNNETRRAIASLATWNDKRAIPYGSWIPLGLRRRAAVVDFNDADASAAVQSREQGRVETRRQSRGYRRLEGVGRRKTRRDRLRARPRSSKRAEEAERRYASLIVQNFLENVREHPEEVTFEGLFLHHLFQISGQPG